MLPSGWNTSQEVYNLHYVAEASGDIYLLKIIRADTDLLIHFMVCIIRIMIQADLLNSFSARTDFKSRNLTSN